MDSSNIYTQMQKREYDNMAQSWSLENIDPVVGTFMAHNNWKDYDDYLFKDISNLKDKIVLDFGCGPGRNIAKYREMFLKMDGVDICETNLKNAKKWVSHNIKNPDLSNDVELYICNGVDLTSIPDSKYDIVMSTICMQHICVYEIRFNYLKEFFRVLKPGGYITIQMGYGENSPMSVDYYANNYNATKTNRGCDTQITNPLQLETDLTKIGFVNFKHYIRPVGPGDFHPNWIFFNAQKP